MRINYTLCTCENGIKCFGMWVWVFVCAGACILNGYIVTAHYYLHASTCMLHMKQNELKWNKNDSLLVGCAKFTFTVVACIACMSTCARNVWSVVEMHKTVYIAQRNAPYWVNWGNSISMGQPRFNAICSFSITVKCYYERQYSPLSIRCVFPSPPSPTISLSPPVCLYMCIYFREVLPIYMWLNKYAHDAPLPPQTTLSNAERKIRGPGIGPTFLYNNDKHTYILASSVDLQPISNSLNDYCFSIMLDYDKSHRWPFQKSKSMLLLLLLLPMPRLLPLCIILFILDTRV